ncbi:MAG: CBS domain-containing protein [Hyphomicrobiaceae bacterium]
MTIAAILKLKGNTVTTVRPSVSVQNAARILAENGIGSLVVVDHGRHPVGIVSERDVVRFIAREGAACLDREVGEIMTPEPKTCREDHTIDEIMAMMTTHRFRHVPVVSDDGLIGIVSIGDVVKHKIAEAEMETAAMRAYITTG